MKTPQGDTMPKLLHARPAKDETEARQGRKLAASRHAPGDWQQRARMIVQSWEGRRTGTIARELGCHVQTVRERLARFNAEGLDGQALTFTGASRNMAGHQQLLEQIDRANPEGDLYVIADNLANHKSPPIQAWLTEHPRVHQVFIPKDASWRNL
jgi:hypothetical protein